MLDLSLVKITDLVRFDNGEVYLYPEHNLRVEHSLDGHVQNVNNYHMFYHTGGL